VQGAEPNYSQRVGRHELFKKRFAAARIASLIRMNFQALLPSPVLERHTVRDPSTARPMSVTKKFLSRTHETGVYSPGKATPKSRLNYKTQIGRTQPVKTHWTILSTALVFGEFAPERSNRCHRSNDATRGWLQTGSDWARFI
jgi:hypothetical protein